MKRISKSKTTVREFNRGLEYLSNEPDQPAHPLLISTAKKLLADLDAKSLRVAYAAFQYGYLLAQVDAAKAWGKSHRPKDLEAGEKQKRDVVAEVKRRKARHTGRTYREIEGDAAERIGRSTRQLRRWRKQLEK